ncbi:hypothetical protein Zmor_013811 [Zophobas morio]|uniref:SprT-like domain-containing protein n=1 Tax=Zophobas morio TaxID=2755281 RepID=A0AA38MG21_9CUCU|nr:hypothetical protein Zmor_013811 [Zophobas morio]
MNTSFELVSSMSPKVNKNHKPVKKAPTILALKKYLRKSLALNNAFASTKNESIISIKSSSASSTSDTRIVNYSPIVISDSENSFSNKTTPVKLAVGLLDKEHTSPVRKKSETGLSSEKYKNIQHWLDKVNSSKKDLSAFTELSAIAGDESSGFKPPEINVAVSSTLLDPETKRFDQLFETKETAMGVDLNISQQSSYKSEKDLNDLSYKSNNLVLNDSLLSENGPNDSKNTIDDSFHLEINESLSTRLQKENNDNLGKRDNAKQNPELCDDYENLLDSLYGNSWREKKEDILPSSEPRAKKKIDYVSIKVPNTERHTNKIPVNAHEDNGSNLLKALQKARFKKTLESPLITSVKKLCDSDTESEKSDSNNYVLPRMRLNFNEDDTNTENRENLIPPSSNIFKKKARKKVTSEKKADPPSKNKITKNTTYSFLASLSGSVPVEKCNLSALIFRNNFHQHKETLAAKLFHLFNENVFENLIPKETPIEWNDRMRGTAGMCSCKKTTRRTGVVERTAKIILAKKVLDSADRLRDTLIHEMCHAATWIVNEISDGHGPFWKSWACRAMKTFPELPPIRRCHNYVINTKYTYRCVACGYSIGRHTKSLDIDRKRCGYCFGKFEVLINKTNKQGETKSVPVTPRKPKGFALFVKENYANCKTPDLKHGDVMKVLGQKFADMKVNKT